jgi:hypothetical protein
MFMIYLYSELISKTCLKRSYLNKVNCITYDRTLRERWWHNIKAIESIRLIYWGKNGGKTHILIDSSSDGHQHFTMKSSDVQPLKNLSFELELGWAQLSIRFYWVWANRSYSNISLELEAQSMSLSSLRWAWTELF